MLTDTPGIVLNLLFLMFSLVTLGEPLRILIACYSGLFERLDILQIWVVNVYLGGLILYVVAIVPLHLFKPAVLCAVLSFSIVFTVFYHLRKLLISRTTMLTWRSILCYVAIFVIFLIVLWIGVGATTNSVFGSVHDSTLFSLFAKVIFENHQIPETLAPYSPEGIIYPQGFFVVMAFVHILLKMPFAEIPLRITPLFQALIVPGAYYLGRKLSSRKLGFSLAFVFAFVSRWPRLLVWGSTAFVAGFPLLFICLSLMPYVVKLDLRNKKRKKRVALFGIGLLCGYLATVHLTLGEVAIFGFFLVGLVRVLRSDSKRTATCHLLKNFSIVLIPALCLISPFVFRAVRWYQYPGHNLGLPEDIVIAPFPPFETINWLLASEGISPYPTLRIEIIILIVVASITILASRQKLKVYKLRSAIAAVLVLICGALVQVLLCFVQYVYPSVGLYTGEFAKPAIIIIVSFLFFIGAFNVILWHEFSRLIGSKRLRIFKRKYVLVDLGAAMVFVQIFLPIYTPFFYYRFAHDSEYLNGQYNLFSVTTQDDLELMRWISDHLPRDSKILVNPSEAGGYLPTVSSINGVIYPFTASRNSRSYETLTTLINLEVLNETTYQLIEQFETDYVFIGSGAIASGAKWDATLFSGNPNFKIVKKVGNSYLFKVLSTSSELMFRDDFEYTNLTEGDWAYSVGGECLGNGTGQAIISSQYAKHEMSSLMMTATKTRGWYFANWIYRKVWLQRTTNVTLSFYLDANCSSSYDFVAIIISDELWESKVYLVAPSLHSSEDMIELPAQHGFFMFDLSRIWHEKMHSPLPNLIYLEIQIADFDGVRDVGFIDYITIRA